MKLRHKRLSEGPAPDDQDSATFGFNCNKSRSISLNKVLRGTNSSSSLSNSQGHSKRIHKCQVIRSCLKPSIGICVEEAYRGCTLAFCEEHSGSKFRLKNEWICCRPCARDKHTDICQECSSDIISARHRFYIITIILALLIFFILIMLVHLLVQQWVPDEFCR